MEEADTKKQPSNKRDTANDAVLWVGPSSHMLLLDVYAVIETSLLHVPIQQKWKLII